VCGKCPVLLVAASHTDGVLAERASTDEAGNLHKGIPLSVNVPIFRVKRDWVGATVACTRTQFPLTIAYSITIHKSQGLSVDAAVLHPGKKRDFQHDFT
jgi:hypothetical protein